MSARKVTGQVHLWLTEYRGPELFECEEDQQVISGLAIVSSDCDMSSAGYTRIGKAAITFDCPNPRDLIDNKADSLRAQIQKTRADAEVAVNALTEKLNNLLALEFDGSIA